MARNPEMQLQLTIVEYIQYAYPDVLFRSDLGGIRLTIGQAKQAKMLQGGRGWPDVFIPEPRKGYYGLFGEIKLSVGDVYIFDKQDRPRMRQSQHILEQYEILCKLNSRGYTASFWCGFDDAKENIDSYLGDKA